MGRIENFLDNREVEYFFSCLKGKFLTRRKTYKLKFKEIKNFVLKYLNQYNEKIQKRLQWLSSQ